MRLCRRQSWRKRPLPTWNDDISTLESEIATASRLSPKDDSAIADLKYRKLIIADEIQHNRRLAQRIGRFASSAG